MDRRRFLLTTLAGALSAPLAAWAQAGKVYRVAFINTTTPVSEMVGAEPAHPFTREFLRALRDLGWVEGKNVIVERRSADGRFERFGDILRELVALNCDVIVTVGTAMAQEAGRVTTTVPIVATGIGDPIEAGLTNSLARPSGDITGWAGLGSEFEGKRVEMLRAALPTAKRVAVLTSQPLWDGPVGRVQRTAAATLALTLFHAECAPNNYTQAFSIITRERPDAILVGQDRFLYANRLQVVEFAVQTRLHLIGQNRDFTDAGALMSYASPNADYARATAGHVDRILRGARPADLPFVRPTKFELVINLKTAKALGLTIPPSLLARADQVIE